MKPTPFSKLLVANRGEIALRVMRSARAAGLRTVAVYSAADADAPHVAFADEAVQIGGAMPSDSYLRIDRILDAARLTGAGAIHPGYGFLSENPAFSQACAEAGVVFVGPSADAIRGMGDKAAAKITMRAAGVPVVPGYDGEDQDLARLTAEADATGYPVMIKAVAGGGGRGMRLVPSATEFAGLLASAKSEAKAAFGDDRVLLERAILEPRHIEIQIMADRYGNVVHLGERDCSVQRRHQKVIEEAPSPAVSPELRARMGAAAVRAAQAIGYEGAGTLEFLLGADGEFYFMEMNTRLQVEHPVTEAITGLDLVALQLQVAAGRPLPITQSEVQLSGHAIEVRLCAEDPDADFMPQSGTLALWEPDQNVRVDHALRSGQVISPYYDSMVAKVIAHGATRDEARQKLVRAVEGTLALGLRTNKAFLVDCLRHPVFAEGGATTAFIAQNRDVLLPERSTAEAGAAALVAALLRAEPSLSLAHGFAAPLRLKRADALHELRVEAGRAGKAVVYDANDAEVLALELLSRRGTRHRLRQNGLIREVDLLQTGGKIWLQIDGRAWDFEDSTYAPTLGAEADGDGKVRASMNGRVVSLDVAVGAVVKRGQKVLVLEAMKMEHAHTANRDGRVEAIHVGAGDQVSAHAVILEIAAE